jgi:hypothetical protein
MELKQSLSERFVRRIVLNRRHLPTWTPYLCWFVPIIQIPIVTLMILNSRDVLSSIWMLTFGFSAAWFSALGYLFWERQGWLHLVDAKDSEIRRLQESRDELESQIVAMVMDPPSAGPDTRIQE